MIRGVGGGVKMINWLNGLPSVFKIEPFFTVWGVVVVGGDNRSSESNPKSSMS